MPATANATTAASATRRARRSISRASRSIVSSHGSNAYRGVKASTNADTHVKSRLTGETGSHSGRARRADARRSIAAILDAAVAVLSERPQASMEEVAHAAGVSRQTVYAHFPARETLIRAVQDRALTEAVAAMDAAELQKGSAAAALERLVAAGWQTLERYPLVLDLRVEMTPEEELALHRPILERLERLIRRGQRRGEFDRTLPATWLLASFLALSHAAGEEVAAGRLKAEKALELLRRSVLRVFGVGTETIDERTHMDELGASEHVGTSR